MYYIGPLCFHRFCFYETQLQNIGLCYRAYLKYPKEKMQLDNLKYKCTLVVGTLLVGICKTANPGAPLHFHGADWLSLLSKYEVDCECSSLL